MVRTGTYQVRTTSHDFRCSPSLAPLKSRSCSAVAVCLVLKALVFMAMYGSEVSNMPWGCQQFCVAAVSGVSQKTPETAAIQYYSVLKKVKINTI